MTKDSTSPATTSEAEVSGSSKISLVLLIVASVALFGAVFLNSPPAMSAAHQQDNSILHSIVNVLCFANAEGTASKFPTPRGIEIRDLFFFLGAAVLMIITGIRLLSAPPRLAVAAHHILDIKRQIKSPIFWYCLLLFISVVSSFFPATADISMGGVIQRLMTFGWWLPLALLLRPVDAKRLLFILVVFIGIMACLGLAYYYIRDVGINQYDNPRLAYPLGNPTWIAACLLPVIFIGGGWLLGAFSKSQAEGTPSKAGGIVGIIIAVISVFALYLTQGRAAMLGLAAGAVMVVFTLVPKRTRMFVLLFALVSAIAGVRYLDVLREEGVMGQRAHSIRSRLNHEWPYAITLWLQRPVGGHGEGSYSMLAGQIARFEQLEDPNILASDGAYWTANAHNEYLELLTDLGAAGMLFFVAAIFVTLWQAIRFIDRNPSSPYRILVIALAVALFAMAIEEGGSVSLRHPGFPPIFFTVWACLWAIIRRDVTDAKINPEDNVAGTVRVLGAACLLFGLGMSYAAVQDWRASLAQQRTVEALAEGRFDEAVSDADFAGSYLLQPFRKVLAQEMAVEARVLRFAQMVESGKELTTSDRGLAQDAAVHLAALEAAVPRFLNVSTLRWQLAFARFIAARSEGNQDLATEYYLEYSQGLERCREDEPFQFGILSRLWTDYVVQLPDGNLAPSLDPLKRWYWLRSYLRRNDIDPPMTAMIGDLLRLGPSETALGELINLAQQDIEREPSEWRDPLSPETFRLAAQAARMSGQQDPMPFIDASIGMYRKAGGRLFRAHGAALRESAQILLSQSPTGDPTEALKRLVDAYEVLEGPMGVPDEKKIEQPLPREIGQTRLAILLAAGREAEARKQVEFLNQGDNSEIDRQMSAAYVRLAESFSGSPKFVDDALAWLKKAEAITEPKFGNRLVETRVHLTAQNVVKAEASAKSAIDLAENRSQPYSYLQQLELQYPDSELWSRLREAYEDFPPKPKMPEIPTTQPAEGEDSSGVPGGSIPGGTEMPDMENDAASGVSQGS